jgi:hypothetical protein
MSDVFVAAVAVELDSTSAWHRAWRHRSIPQISRKVRRHRLTGWWWRRSSRPKHQARLQPARWPEYYRRAVARIANAAPFVIHPFVIHRATSPPIVDRVRDTWARNLPAGWLEQHGYYTDWNGRYTVA